ncbi:MAG: large conductance mechanosensitive channel protein MscL [Clostridia bacterium]|nr:large conductance mechanosensitive channel protein MscL [Clostridia bacterium]
MKRFFSEFKTFISRGNVVDMAVGVIVGSSFTAIVNGLSNNVLKPIINWLLALIFGADSLSEVYTVLKRADLPDGTLDLANSIYIDWGAFLNAVLNFFLVAFVLFMIVRVINRVRTRHKALTARMLSGVPRRRDLADMRRRGVCLADPDAVRAYYAEREKEEREAAEKKAAEEAEKARLEREKNPTAEDLLREIRDLLKKE